MKKFLLLLIPLLLLLGWLYARGQGPAEVPFTKATRETLVSTLNTNGKVEPIEWAPAHAAVGGPVQQIHVERGQAVRKGQLLVTLAIPEAESEIGSAQARINAARAEIDALNQGGRASEQAEIESGLIRGRTTLLQRNRISLRWSAWLRAMQRQRPKWKRRGKPYNARSNRSKSGAAPRLACDSAGPCSGASAIAGSAEWSCGSFTTRRYRSDSESDRRSFVSA